MRGNRIPTPVLMHWYVCGRKEPLASEVIARLYAPGKSAYQCPHGQHWHVGRAIQRDGNHAARHSRKMNARKAWDQQAYKAREMP